MAADSKAEEGVDGAAQRAAGEDRSFQQLDVTILAEGDGDEEEENEEEEEEEVLRTAAATKTRKSPRVAAVRAGKDRESRHD